MMERTGCYAAIRKNGAREWLDVRTIAPFVSETGKLVSNIDAKVPKWAADNPVVRYSHVCIAEKLVREPAAGAKAA